MNIFEEIRKMNEHGEECWSARDLQGVLGYAQWRNFVAVIEKAKVACENAGITPSLHFADVSKSYELPTGGLREINDIELTRYACYLIVQNADPEKEVIAMGQTYFAIQTRRQELADKFEQLNEDERRLQLRMEIKAHNTQLAQAANKAGVKTNLDFAIFQNHGYKGLYGGLDAKDIHKRKELKKSQQILDHMGSTELAANLFRATQTEEKLRKEGIQ
ncbi:MAG: DNA damage-inducible protein D, partial [Clostridiales bacterium]|nr:DNA damage-inducible protein D [Clostridiales bacterium]